MLVYMYLVMFFRTIPVCKRCCLFKELSMKWFSIVFYKLHENQHVSKVASVSEDPSPVRVRFAPSPTGYLHIGGLRTAFYNYIFAKARNGSFILRSEDTDQSRLISDSLEKILDDLAWVSIIPDESPIRNGIYGPYVQSQRNSIYHSHIQQLLEKGLAYKCFCSADRLISIRENFQGVSYDNKCRSLNSSEVFALQKEGIPYCVRFKINHNEIEPFRDWVFGMKHYSISKDEGDFILLKSDGTPTYHFANVVDDHLMKITHVFRGSEWISSTSKHLLLYKAFSWIPPEFGHLPELYNEDGTKLSKRQKHLSVQELRQQGYSPETILNFITATGGGFSREKESIMTLEQLIANFDHEKLRTTHHRIETDMLLRYSRMDLQEKLSHPESTRNIVVQLKKELKVQLSSMCVDVDLSDEYVLSVLLWSPDRIYKWKDLVAPGYRYLWAKPDQQAAKMEVSRLTLNPEFLLSEVITSLKELRLEEATAKNIQQRFNNIKNENKLKTAPFLKLLRLTICGIVEGPPVAEVISLLGLERSIHRMECFLDFLQHN